MLALKDKVSEMIHNLPKRSTLEDIQYHLYVLEKIRNSQKTIKDGKRITNEAMKARLSKWL
jgi:hypothetical protein